MRVRPTVQTRWVKCGRYGRNPARRSLAALVLAALTAITPVQVAFGVTRLYGGVTNHVDRFAGANGYIRHSGINMVDCADNFVASWLGLGEPNQERWVQIGQTQGDLLGNCAASDTRMYAEQQDCGGAKYALWDLGRPPTPNYPVYVNRTGATAIDPCTQQTDYQWAFRVGSLTSAPKAYGWVKMSSGTPSAVLEDMWTTTRENIGTDKFGLNHSGAVQSGFGLSLYRTSNSWTTWTASVAPNTQPRDDGVLISAYYRNWSSFEVHD